MKKSGLVINLAIILSFLLTAYYFVVNCWTANFCFVESGKVHAAGDATPYISLAAQNTIFAVIEAILLVALAVALFLFNYRFDGVSLREKVSKRLAESKEKRVQYRAEKAEADRKKRVEELQKELDDLKGGD